MDGILNGVKRFRCEVFPDQQQLYQRLVRDGQQPQALVISCADSRVAPELITQSGPGDLFVSRNVGNIVPPFSQVNGGVSSAIEYAIMGLGVRDIVVCGHSDCGAMKALLKPGSLDGMPNVAAWLRHSHAARQVVENVYPADLDPSLRAAALAQENVLFQINHLRSHPSVAAALAKGDLTLHGWFFDLHTGDILALDGENGFKRVTAGDPLPVAVAPAERRVAKIFLEAAE
jgi:carbonic anhydrase